MNKEFVTYEQALTLKELGFDEPCLKMGMSDIDIINTERTDEGDYPKNSHLFSGWVAIPTYSQAFRWFREKHKLIAYPQWRIDNTWDITIQQLDGYGLLSGQTTLSVIKKSIYEEAEQECLNKLIQIVKNNAHI